MSCRCISLCFYNPVVQGADDHIVGHLSLEQVSDDEHSALFLTQS